MTNRLLAAILMIALAGCSSNQSISTGSVVPVASELPNAHGLYYYLPKTALQIELIAEKRVQKAGPFYRYAQRYLNISDVITEDKDEWVIVDAQVTTVGEPDKSKLFRVNSSGFPSMAALNLTEEGVLLGVNLPPKKEASALESPKVSTKPVSLADVNFNDAPLTEEQLIKSSTLAMAEELAKEIYHLREIRNEILKGEMETGANMKELLAEMDRVEKAYLSLFTGKTVTERVSAFYHFLPEPEKSINTVLLRFSDRNGFLDKMDVSGTPIYIEVEVAQTDSNNYVALENDKSPNRRGLVYNNPAKANVRIIDRTLLLRSQEVLLGQHGQVLRLPADLTDAPGVGVELDPATGALKRVFNSQH